jgi:hypothetical protein
VCVLDLKKYAARSYQQQSRMRRLSRLPRRDLITLTVRDVD